MAKRKTEKVKKPENDEDIKKIIHQIELLHEASIGFRIHLEALDARFDKLVTALSKAKKVKGI